MKTIIAFVGRNELNGFFLDFNFASSPNNFYSNNDCSEKINSYTASIRANKNVQLILHFFSSRVNFNNKKNPNSTDKCMCVCECVNSF